MIYDVILLYAYTLNILLKTFVISCKHYVVYAYVIIIMVDLLVSGKCKSEIDKWYLFPGSLFMLPM